MGETGAASPPTPALPQINGLSLSYTVVQQLQNGSNLDRSHNLDS